MAAASCPLLLLLLLLLLPGARYHDGGRVACLPHRSIIIFATGSKRNTTNE
jgi:hypothetical protein